MQQVQQLNIDWLALVGAFQMNMPEVQCFLSLQDGRVLKLRPGDKMLPVVRNEPLAYLNVPPIPSIVQYQWVDEFILALNNDYLGEQLRTAINGKGAFRRFKDILLSYPEERRRWFELRDLKMRQYVMQWVLEQGLQPQQAPPWLAEGETLPTAAELAPAHPNGRVSNVNNGNSVSSANNNALNSSQDIETLRDFLQEWVDNWLDNNVSGQATGNSTLTPMALETLAEEISKRFVLRPRAATANAPRHLQYDYSPHSMA